ncbi:MAG TPA: trypsin-like serine protease [Polyangiaceae bacterium]|nr:trypsin-like serine protease [Polyangiaceae bacterium]
MIRPLLAVPVLCVAVAACGAESTPDAEFRVNAQAIAGGVVDTENTHVLGISSWSEHGGGLCTGTLIAPNLVLTARHCVSPSLNENEFVVCGQSGFGEPYSGNALRFTQDVKISYKSKNWRLGTTVRVPKEGNDTCGFDVALVILDKPMAGVTPAVPRIDVEPQVGELYTAIGYGTTDTGGGGQRMLLDGLQVQCTSGNCPYYTQVQSTEWQGQTGVCQGDSGGPAVDQDGKIIGVVSRGQGKCSSPTYGSVWAWKDFIMETALEAAATGGYEPPFWALSGVSDDPNPPPPVTEPEPTGPKGPDIQGGPCGVGRGCGSDYACYDPGGGGTAYCAAFCEATTDCGQDLVCSADLGVCLAPVAAAAESEQGGGCSVTLSSENGPVRPVPWLVGLALVLLRRRRR